jgi:hypothetical protein
MKEQTGKGMQAITLVKRATRQPAPPPSSPHYTGHSAGLYGEDQPYTTDDQAEEDTESTEEMEDEILSGSRLPRSAIRYQTYQDDRCPPQTQTVIVHRLRRNRRSSEPQPALSGKPQGQPHRHPHWLAFVGVGMIVMLGLWVLLNLLLSWWQLTQQDWQYGRPRTFQIDAVVGHNDSAANPTHFIAINLNRHVEIIELPGGDSSKARIYSGPVLIGEGQDLVPVTLSFKDVNGDGKPDMLVHIQNDLLVWLNDTINGVPVFRPLKPGEHVNV